MAKRHYDESLFDKRVIEWNLRNGIISEEDFNSFLKSLPDDSKNAEEHILWEDNEESESGLTFSSIISEKS